MARQRRGRARVRRPAADRPGIELGEPLADLKRTEAILDAYDFDFVLGSQHKLNSLDRETNIDYYFYDYTGKDVGLVMDEYFDAVLELVNWGRFHALAHLTYPFRYIPEEKRPADFSRWQDRIDAILRQLAVKGLALEINTSGLRQPGGTTHPPLSLVRRFRQLGGEFITIGADAHRPEDVGTGLEQAAALARKRASPTRPCSSVEKWNCCRWNNRQSRRAEACAAALYRVYSLAAPLVMRFR